MMLQTPFRCWRGEEDCEPLHAIEALPEDITLELFESPDFTPTSFVCCGIIHDEEREIAQDCYRLCFKNEVSDEMSDNDLQDLTHIQAVIAQALAITATRMVNSGTVQVPTMQGALCRSSAGSEHSIPNAEAASSSLADTASPPHI